MTADESSGSTLLKKCCHQGQQHMHAPANGRLVPAREHDPSSWSHADICRQQQRLHSADRVDFVSCPCPGPACCQQGAAATPRTSWARGPAAAWWPLACCGAPFFPRSAVPGSLLLCHLQNFCGNRFLIHWLLYHCHLSEACSPSHQLACCGSCYAAHDGHPDLVQPSSRVVGPHLHLAMLWISGHCLQGHLVAGCPGELTQGPGAFEAGHIWSFCAACQTSA